MPSIHLSICFPHLSIYIASKLHLYCHLTGQFYHTQIFKNSIVYQKALISTFILVFRLQNNISEFTTHTQIQKLFPTENSVFDAGFEYSSYTHTNQAQMWYVKLN